MCGILDFCRKCLSKGLDVSPVASYGRIVGKDKNRIIRALSELIDPSEIPIQYGGTAQVFSYENDVDWLLKHD